MEACREIMESLPETRVLMLTASTEANAVIEAVAGLRGRLSSEGGRDGPGPGHDEERGSGRGASCRPRW